MNTTILALGVETNVELPDSTLVPVKIVDQNAEGWIAETTDGRGARCIIPFEQAPEPPAPPAPAAPVALPGLVDPSTCDHQYGMLACLKCGTLRPVEGAAPMPSLPAAPRGSAEPDPVGTITVDCEIHGPYLVRWNDDDICPLCVAADEAEFPDDAPELPVNDPALLVNVEASPVNTEAAPVNAPVQALASALAAIPADKLEAVPAVCANGERHTNPVALVDGACPTCAELERLEAENDARMAAAPMLTSGLRLGEHSSDCAMGTAGDCDCSGSLTWERAIETGAIDPMTVCDNCGRTFDAHAEETGGCPSTDQVLMTLAEAEASNGIAVAWPCFTVGEYTLEGLVRVRKGDRIVTDEGHVGTIVGADATGAGMMTDAGELRFINDAVLDPIEREPIDMTRPAPAPEVSEAAELAAAAAPPAPAGPVKAPDEMQPDVPRPAKRIPAVQVPATWDRNTYEKFPITKLMGWFERKPLPQLAEELGVLLDRKKNAITVVQTVLDEGIPRRNVEAMEEQLVTLDQYGYAINSALADAEALLDKAQESSLIAPGAVAPQWDIETGSKVGSRGKNTGTKQRAADDADFEPKYKDLTDTYIKTYQDCDVAPFRRYRNELKAISEAMVNRTFNLKRFLPARGE